jgi:hypothetical protein
MFEMSMNITGVSEVLLHTAACLLSALDIRVLALCRLSPPAAALLLLPALSKLLIDSYTASDRACNRGPAAPEAEQAMRHASRTWAPSAEEMAEIPGRESESSTHSGSAHYSWPGTPERSNGRSSSPLQVRPRPHMCRCLPPACSV